MKQYYIIESGQKTGPYSISELQKQKIPYDMDIWSETEKDWFPAKAIPELRPYLINDSKEDSGEDSDKYFGYRLATLGERFLGDLLHSIATLIIYAAYFIPVNYLTLYITENKNDVTVNLLLASLADFYLAFSGLGALITFRFIFYPKFRGNIGHKFMGLKVINSKDGSDCQILSTSFMREFLKLIINYAVIFNAWLVINKDCQNLYDKAVKTYVVKKIKYDEVE